VRMLRPTQERVPHRGLGSLGRPSLLRGARMWREVVLSAAYGPGRALRCLVRMSCFGGTCRVRWHVCGVRLSHGRGRRVRFLARNTWERRLLDYHADRRNNHLVFAVRRRVRHRGVERWGRGGGDEVMIQRKAPARELYVKGHAHPDSSCKRHKKRPNAATAAKKRVLALMHTRKWRWTVVRNRRHDITAKFCGPVRES